MRLSGPEEPLEPLTPSPYPSVIYSAPRTRSKGGPKRPVTIGSASTLLAGPRPRPVATCAAPVSAAVRWVCSVLPGSFRSAGPGAFPGRPRPSLRPKPLGTGAKSSKAVLVCQTGHNPCPTMVFADSCRSCPVPTSRKNSQTDKENYVRLQGLVDHVPTRRSSGRRMTSVRRLAATRLPSSSCTRISHTAVVLPT
jgi:hypothetical protein